MASDNGQKDLISDLADALTLDREVQWDRCAKRALPADRDKLRNLKIISGVLRSRPAAGQTSGTAPATSLDPRVGPFVRWAVKALVAIAAVEVTAALIVLAWSWEAYFGEQGDASLVVAIGLSELVASACLLLFGGGRERRTRALGLYCLLKATMNAQSILLSFFGDVPLQQLVPDYLLEGPRLVGYLVVPVYVFAPAFLWAFAAEWPRARGRHRLDGLARRMVPVSVAIGSGVWIACAAAAERARAGYGEAHLDLVFDAALFMLHLLGFAAAAAVPLSARSATAGESRRLVLFSLGFAVFLGAWVVYNAAEAFTPGSWLSNFRWSPTLQAMAAMRVPGTILLWYGLMAVRVPYARELVRASYTQPLKRPGLLGGAAAAAVVALVLLVASRPDRAAGAIFADPLAQSLFAAAGILCLAFFNHERILSHLEARTLPEVADQRQALADAAAELSRAGRMTTVSRTVTRAARSGGGSPAALLLVAGSRAEARELRAESARITPLPTNSAIVHLLEGVGGPLRVHPEHPKSIFPLLPPEEAAWVEETESDVIVPVPIPGMEGVGALVVGRRFDGRIVRGVDVPFLEALGSMAGLAAARLRLLDAGEAAPEPPPAQECPICGSLAGSGEMPGCECGAAYVETDVPQLLAGKYRLTRCLGTGGMGAVYLARDLRLDRDIAIKTIAGTSALRLMQLKPEAWAMATVAHPAVAQIHGVESWRGRPFLVVEFLSGGTLADRLEQGPVPAAEAVPVIAVLADALAALHEKGFLHGDIKPSNIGFTSSGSPKLLDFGLARTAHDSAAAGGTLRNVSPEALAGCPADEADDVWSLCVVLYEAVSGRHPFAGGSADEVAERIQRQSLVRPSAPQAGPACEAVVAFASSVLTAARSMRPKSAGAFAEALRAVRWNGSALTEDA